MVHHGPDGAGQGRAAVYLDHGAGDMGVERSKLSNRIEEIAADIANYRKRLDNDSYVQNAPPHVVQETRDQLQAAEQDLSAAEQALSVMEAT